MQSYKIYPVGFAANSYLVTADGRSAVCIDPAQPRIAQEAERRGLSVTHVLLTHGHFDHTGGAHALQERGAKVGCLKGEEVIVPDAELAAAFGAYAPGRSRAFISTSPSATGRCFRSPGLPSASSPTPGHTAGGASFLIGDRLYSGDTLFAGDIGRSDLPTGSGAQLVASVKKLYALEGDYTVCPGHGEDTTLEYERRHNGWVRC